MKRVDDGSKLCDTIHPKIRNARREQWEEEERGHSVDVGNNWCKENRGSGNEHMLMVIIPESSSLELMRLQLSTACSGCQLLVGDINIHS